MSCLITVKGDGKGLNGHPKTDRTGPLSEFLIDNVHFYTAVRKHLKTCQTCSPTDVLQVYLNRRLASQKDPKKPLREWFPVSSTLLSNAMMYGRQWPETLPLVKQFLLYTFSPAEFMDHIDWYTNDQVIDYFARWQKRNPDFFPISGKHDRFKILLSIPNLESVSGDELDHIMSVAEIIQS